MDYKIFLHWILVVIKREAEKKHGSIYNSVIRFIRLLHGIQPILLFYVRNLNSWLIIFRLNDDKIKHKYSHSHQKKNDQLKIHQRSLIEQYWWYIANFIYLCFEGNRMWKRINYLDYKYRSLQALVSKHNLVGNKFSITCPDCKKETEYDNESRIFTELYLGSGNFDFSTFSPGSSFAVSVVTTNCASKLMSIWCMA